MSLDFFLPDKNIAIECQGIQHFQAIDFFGGENAFQKTLQRDEHKKKLCHEHKIKSFYYCNKKYKNNIITKKEQILKKILDCKK